MPTQDVLRELLICDERTGKIYWRKRSPKWFPNSSRFSPEAAARMWNGRNAGKRAFKMVSTSGYFAGTILGYQFRAHRIIWVYFHGTTPETIDHINGDKRDNRLCNLRDVKQSEQSTNKSVYSTNTTGVAGVSP